MDVFTPAKRSEVMSHIRSNDTHPEIFVRRLLFSAGFRYRLHVAGLPGKPDIVLRKYHTVIFVNGCFWHGHKGCHKAVKPETRSGYWVKKLARNKERDEQNCKTLLEIGWRVLIVWECACLKRFERELSERMYSFLREDKCLRAEIGRAELEASTEGQT